MEKDFWHLVGRHHHVFLAAIVSIWIFLATISPAESSATETVPSVVPTQERSSTLFSPSNPNRRSPALPQTNYLADQREANSQPGNLTIPKLAAPRPATTADLSFHVKSASINRPQKASEPWEVLLTLQVRNESDAAVEFDPSALLVQMGNASARTPEDVIPVRISASRPVMVPVSVSYSGRPSSSYRISYRGATVLQGNITSTLR